jgi:cystathionine beta-lyase/cystathionine gamma-synthase
LACGAVEDGESLEIIQHGTSLGSVETTKSLTAAATLAS